MPQLAAALASRGHAVTIVQAFHENVSLKHGEIDVVMTRDASAGRAAARKVPQIVATLDTLRPAIIHVFGLARSPQLAAIAAVADRTGAQLSASFHGGAPPRNPIAKALHRKALARVAAVFFSAPHYAAAWQRSGIISSPARLVIAPEVSSPFAPLDRRAARAELGLDSGAVFAWSGRLHPVKDPFTTLRCFELLVAQQHEVRLLMAFRTSELMPQILAFLAARPAVLERVRLLGEWPHERMPVLFSAADFFVQSSISEVGGNSLVEAMSCGAIPVVTDIPAFRMLTDDGRVARLFPPGDAEAMAQAVMALAEDDRSALASRVRMYFDERLCYAALARIYDETFSAICRQS
jgi:glycosyltransferase involved in cell wall biosynthesis